MSILGLGRTLAADLPPEAYLSAEVSGKEAAQILGISESRWRQITGDRPDPDPILGPRINRPGTRGSLWSLRGVLNYAIEKDQRLLFPVPPLMPLPRGPRYRSVQGHTWNAPSTAVIRDRHAPARPAAFARLFRARSQIRGDLLCHHKQSAVLFLTELWTPEGRQTLLSPPDIIWSVQHVLSSTPGWDGDPTSVAVVISRNDSSGGRPWPKAQVFEFTQQTVVEMLRRSRNGQAPTEWVDGSGYLGYSADYMVPAQDVADCLGWDALPFWPEGTATVSTCTRWHPTAPVTVTVPASLERRLELTTWLSSRHTANPAEAEDMRAVARIFDPTSERLSRQVAGEPLPAGFANAVEVTWPEPIADVSQDARPWRALNKIYSDPQVAPSIAADIHAWIGDPQYAPAASLQLADLPDQWRKFFAAFAEQALPVDPTTATPRVHRLLAASEASPADQRITVRGPHRAPTLFTPSTVTWLAPTGYRDSQQATLPAETIAPDREDPPTEALLLREPNTNGVTGWVRTAAGRIAPLPAKSQWGVGDDDLTTMVFVAALLGRSFEDVAEARQKMFASSNDGAWYVEPLPLTQELRKIGPTPITIPWPDLTRLASLTWDLLTAPAPAPNGA